MTVRCSFSRPNVCTVTPRVPHCLIHHLQIGSIRTAVSSHANTTGKISHNSIESCSSSGLQDPMSHWLPQTRPKPRLDASVYSSASTGLVQCGSISMDFLFQFSMHAWHQLISSLASISSGSTRSMLYDNSAVASNWWQANVLSGGMTFAANDRLLARDEIFCSRLSASLPMLQGMTQAAGGSHSSLLAVSISLPKKVIEVLGGVTLSGLLAIGIRRRSKAASESG